MFLAACCRPSREEGVPLQGSIQGRAWGGSRCSERRRRGCRGRPSTWQSTIVLTQLGDQLPSTWRPPPPAHPSPRQPATGRAPSCPPMPSRFGVSGKLLSNAIAFQLYGLRGRQKLTAQQLLSIDFLRPTSIWWVPLFWRELAAADWGRWRHQQRPLHCFEADNHWSETSVIRENTTSGVFDW